jgi:DoxX-like family
LPFLSYPDVRVRHIYVRTATYWSTTLVLATECLVGGVFPRRDAASSRGRVVGYWVTTVPVAAELAVGGVWDLLRTDYVRDVVEHLGYPTYLLTIMGVWKLPGAVVLLVSRFGRLQQWVYAGAVINFASAAASHVIVGDSLAASIAPAAHRLRQRRIQITSVSKGGGS